MNATGQAMPWPDSAAVKRGSRYVNASATLMPYRAVADPTRRLTKHEFGCVYVCYSCTKTHRRIMGLIRALLSSSAIPG